MRFDAETFGRADAGGHALPPASHPPERSTGTPLPRGYVLRGVSAGAGGTHEEFQRCRAVEPAVAIKKPRESSVHRTIAAEKLPSLKILLAFPRPPNIIRDVPRR